MPVNILEISSTNGSLHSRGHCICMGHYSFDVSLAVLLFTLSSTIAASATNLTHAGKSQHPICTCACCAWLQSYTRCHTCMGRYNRELSARWSFGGNIFKGGLLSRESYYSASMVCLYSVN